MESEKTESNRTVHEIEGIGSIRAQNGTALDTIAGAATFWNGEYNRLEKQVEAQLEKVSKKKWKDGMLTGSVSTVTLFTLAYFLVRFLS